MRSLSLTLIALSLVAGGACLAAAPAAEVPEYHVKLENNVAMKTRDGVTLRADVFHPKEPGTYPVILLRTPYNKYSNVNEGLKGAARGYVFIIQDVRGREASEGEWYPFKYEAADGYDAVEWAAGLPYSNGKVALFGGSYPGATQMLAATSSPPHLVAMFPEITGSNYYNHWAYQGGAFMRGLAQAWASALSINEHVRKIAGTAGIANWDPMRAPADYQLVDVGSTKDLARFYFDWIKHPTYDDYWKQWAIDEQFGKIMVPAIHIAAWYDLFQDGGIRNYRGIKQHGGTEAARQGQRLVIVPGGHSGFGSKIGEVDFGPNAVFSTWELAFRWFDWQMKGIDTGIAKEKPVKIFVMGENVFRDEDEWPLARAVSTRYFLHSGGHANTLDGDGVISLAAPQQETADQYVYDPANPVPTHGGAILGIPNPPGGAYDQREVERRPDVLVYTSAPFEKPTEVTGPMSLEAYVSSSAVDTDLVGKIVDVAPDGRAINLSEGILRLRYRNSFERAEFLTPGQVYKVTVDLWSTSNLFLAGHRLRLEVSSGSFPRFDRNLNTADYPGTATTGVKATNVIYHDQAHPSVLVLPVVPR